MAPAKLKKLKTQLDELLEKRLYPAQYVPMKSPDVVHEKEGWNPEIVCRL